MFYDIFESIKINIDQSRELTSPSLFNINPSSQVCFNDDGKSVGACLRQIWFDKTKSVTKTNNISLKAKMAGFSGNWWEDWFIDQMKALHIYKDSNVPATDVPRFMKGLVDVVIKNPNSGKVELVEVKTYNGSIWNIAQNIHGSTKVTPKPKMNHLLQSFRYLIVYKEQVEAINICYIDRSCGDWYKHKQFRITLMEIDGRHYPNIECVYNDELYSYVETEVSMEGILEAEDVLIQFFADSTTPPKDYIELYDDQTIIRRYMDGLVPEYLYKKWQTNPDKTPIGDFQCAYCPYYGGACSNYD